MNKTKFVYRTRFREFIGEIKGSFKTKDLGKFVLTQTFVSDRIV